ncbi:protein translocase subunit SecD [Candidatus Dependentiae bacterium]|nr:protein translocase subunit SecD [Candidatus Dependentiae bacterium]
MRRKSILWRSLLVVVVVVLAIMSIIPTLKWYSYSDEERLEKLTSAEIKQLEERKISLGLDLQGGIRVVLEVDTSEIPAAQKKDAIDRVIAKIRTRIDEFGVSEPTVAKEGSTKIVVELPGIADTDRAIDLIQSTAYLEFKLLDEKGDITRYIDPETGKIVKDVILPRGREILFQYGRDEYGKVLKKPFLVKSKTLLTGDMIKDARMNFSSSTMGAPYVTINFNKKGGKIFYRITSQHVNERLAIILDDVIISAPVIDEPIPSGSARISGGGFTLDTASDLALKLRTGALPAPVIVLHNQTIGPSLGKDSIYFGAISILIGGVFVILFMLFYYKASGLIVNFALFLNLIIVLGIMTLFHFTLTLPGIAGLILTVGMAVDANVLIFERTKEELRLGKTVGAAIDAGFKKAWVTILDANVTTLIAALVLFKFGTGPIKGFAVTLSIGILASMFTAIVFTKLAFDIILNNFKVKKLSI